MKNYKEELNDAIGSTIFLHSLLTPILPFVLFLVFNDYDFVTGIIIGLTCVFVMIGLILYITLMHMIWTDEDVKVAVKISKHNRKIRRLQKRLDRLNSRHKKEMNKSMMKKEPNSTENN